MIVTFSIFNCKGKENVSGNLTIDVNKNIDNKLYEQFLLNFLNTNNEIYA